MTVDGKQIITDMTTTIYDLINIAYQQHIAIDFKVNAGTTTQKKGSAKTRQEQGETMRSVDRAFAVAEIVKFFENLEIKTSLQFLRQSNSNKLFEGKSEITKWRKSGFRRSQRTSARTLPRIVPQGRVTKAAICSSGKQP